MIMKAMVSPWLGTGNVTGSGDIMSGKLNLSEGANENTLTPEQRELIYEWLIEVQFHDYEVDDVERKEPERNYYAP